MEYSGASGAASGGDEQITSNSSRRKGKKKVYHRHSPNQIQQLEAFFKECPHPDESQRIRLSRELGLESQQIKFWFQNKRTQTKTQSERQDNSTLRAENERIQCENIAIREALKNVICPACGGPPFGEEERQHSLQKLQLENAQLRQEHDKVSALLAKYAGKPVDALLGVNPPPLNFSMPTLLNPIGIKNPAVGRQLNSIGADFFSLAPYQRQVIPEMEKALMMETAATALDELIRLLQNNEPLWIKVSSNDRLVIHRDSYEKSFPRYSHFNSPGARVESSKDSGLVTMNGLKLVDMLLDSNKWIDLFPSIVTKASTLQVLEPGTRGNRSGALQLMYGQMHVLSPLVPTREFFFLRHCHQIEAGLWVIVDISYESMKDRVLNSRCWRLPSGCMIQEMPNGCSKVTWVEHVEVDDRNQTHRLYRDVVRTSSAYGAQRWIATLERMCERMAFSARLTVPANEPGGEGRRSLMMLGHRMVKNFCAILSMTPKLDFPHLSEVNNSGVRVAVRNNTEPGQPSGLVVSAATSVWIALQPQSIFNFLRDEKTRAQWDVLSSGNQAQEVGHISNGSHRGNCISLIRPFIPNENNMLLFQESCIDPLGMVIVYAPIDLPSLNVAVSGADSSNIPILPSGFIISSDGGHPDSAAANGGGASTSTANSKRSPAGSLLTVAFQILVSTPSGPNELNMESVATVNTLISSTVQRIKRALDSNMD
ncbi:homeobox-leucine zipper protein HDG11 isoform X2 [Tripterygium wilfordii]|uniref:Homeobox-leucine zipper protein HDG11 isoform X2 n=2 Tax=Tripterygium wilfordii TaxID=458696 RepID=A0A7J7DP63_TRIWF|nr:homeobox-leucine zipper protein HDG11 isoform X2 [Tripterygium wilfordii]